MRGVECEEWNARTPAPGAAASLPRTIPFRPRVAFPGSPCLTSVPHPSLLPRRAAADLIRLWDKDRNGSIDRAEFVQNVKAMVPSAEEKESQELFATLDTGNKDGGGTKDGSLDLDEVNQMLRTHPAWTPHPHPQPTHTTH